VESTRTAYVVPGTVLTHESGDPAEEGDCEAAVGKFLPRENFLTLHEEDVLIITRNGKPGRPAVHDDTGHVVEPAVIGCTIPEVFDDVAAGESIWFDDGRIGGVIEKVARSRIQVRITHTRIGGGKLRADKGINLPDSQLDLPALTEKDRADLESVARLADIVALSFVERPRDVADLDAELRRLGSTTTGLVLKIETRRGFASLPNLVLQAIGTRPLGVMIARGDMAVECGYERLAEIQEEMLWLCEAAHLPVIWATQVLDRLSRKGLPTRAEITDAAMAERAECVMLNKGPHIQDAISLLDGILRRMETHQHKKSATLRPLAVSQWLSE
jgi:pyruvate kinase